MALCYFIVCFALNQCVNYQRVISGYLPAETQLDMFYWRNPTGQEVDPQTQFSLFEMSQDTSAFGHWKVVHSDAMYWMPFYHYHQNTDYLTQCSDGFVKLDPYLMFSQPGTDYDALFKGISQSMVEQHVKLASLESSCTASDEPVQIESATVLRDLELFISMMNGFQRRSAQEGYHFYIRGSLNRFLAEAANQDLYPSTKLDYADCIDTSTTINLDTIDHTADSYSFMRVGPNTDVVGEHINLQEVDPKGASSDGNRISGLVF